MNHIELAHLKDDVDAFIANNKERYEIIMSFQDQLGHISSDSLTSTISFIKENHDVFFKDHSSAIFFLYNIFHFSYVNFKQLELIVDIGHSFLSDLKKANVSEANLIELSLPINFSIINLMFEKGMIGLPSIIEKSNFNRILFVNFLPEIEKYDREYVKIREKTLFYNDNNEHLVDVETFYKIVRDDPEKHLYYRHLNHHPSSLHKAIRDDDIDTFQSLLSSNNIDVNYHFDFSFYERICLEKVTKQPSLIHVAALYGSVTVFKYLWIQDGIILDGNLQCFAFFGRNYDIIHLCEKKCQPNKFVLSYLIDINDIDLIHYYLYNYEEKEDENQILLNFYQNYKKIKNFKVGQSNLSNYHDKDFKKDKNFITGQNIENIHGNKCDKIMRDGNFNLNRNGRNTRKYKSIEILNEIENHNENNRNFEYGKTKQIGNNDNRNKNGKNEGENENDNNGNGIDNSKNGKNEGENENDNNGNGIDNSKNGKNEGENENDNNLNEEDEEDESEEGNLLDKLNLMHLLNSISSANYSIIIPCLLQITFAVASSTDDKIDENSANFYMRSFYDDSLFNFLYAHRNQEMSFVGVLFSVYADMVQTASHDAFRILIEKEGMENMILVFVLSIFRNTSLTLLFLDWQLAEIKNEKKERKMFDYFRRRVSLNNLLCLIENFNEEAVLKMIQIYGFIDSRDDFDKFIRKLKMCVSPKMIHSLFLKLESLFPGEFDLIK
ncbi:hypothetical protein M9Y10_045452 [Tritrichomonas musculus]|uniref:DUF3447 domain-containing protein n=1 Tax=Tritrichomonas musculus TaxID=1915356 RepID=A0ABR2JVA6_9EUKA